MWEIARFPFEADAERQMAVFLEQVRRDGELALAPGRVLLLWRTGRSPQPTPPSAAPRHPGITLCVMATVWDDPAQDERELGWVRRTAEALRASGVVEEAANTANHTADADVARVARVYGEEAYARLAALKRRYDPDNVFRRNFNVPPAS
jgi:hypothetical protein